MTITQMLVYSILAPLFFLFAGVVFLAVMEFIMSLIQDFLKNRAK